MRLDLVIGPNGAGKTTFVEQILAPALPGAPFVNADIIAAQRWPQDPQGHSYDAAQVAAATRAALIEAGASLMAETVFSHPSKLDLIDAANAAGYTVSLHVLLVPVELSVHRVTHRVASGGHAVPEDKIRQRHTRLWPLVVDAVGRCASAHLWDNSRRDGPTEVALFARGMLIGPARWPTWTPAELTARWP